MFCPLCQAEYRAGFTRCSECDVQLVEVLPPRQEGSAQDESLEGRHLVRLWMGVDPVLYSALTAALEGGHIPFFDNPPRDFGNWLVARSRTGTNMESPNFDIQVPEKYFAAANEILKALFDETGPNDSMAP